MASIVLEFTRSSPFTALRGLHPSVLLVWSLIVVSIKFKLVFVMSSRVRMCQSPLFEKEWSVQQIASVKMTFQMMQFAQRQQTLTEQPSMMGFLQNTWKRHTALTTQCHHQDTQFASKPQT